MIAESGGDADLRGSLLSCYAKCEVVCCTLFPFDQGYFCPTGFLLLGKVFNEATRGAPPSVDRTRGSV